MLVWGAKEGNDIHMHSTPEELHGLREAKAFHRRNELRIERKGHTTHINTMRFEGESEARIAIHEASFRRREQDLLQRVADAERAVHTQKD